MGDWVSVSLMTDDIVIIFVSHRHLVLASFRYEASCYLGACCWDLFLETQMASATSYKAFVDRLRNG